MTVATLAVIAAWLELLVCGLPSGIHQPVGRLLWRHPASRAACAIKRESLEF
jgi:hypothetical protein